MPPIGHAVWPHSISTAWSIARLKMSLAIYVPAKELASPPGDHLAEDFSRASMNVTSVLKLLLRDALRPQAVIRKRDGSAGTPSAIGSSWRPSKRLRKRMVQPSLKSRWHGFVLNQSSAV